MMKIFDKLFLTAYTKGDKNNMTKMLQRIAGPAVVLWFLFLLGTGGALEIGVISAQQASIQFVIGCASFFGGIYMREYMWENS